MGVGDTVVIESIGLVTCCVFRETQLFRVIGSPLEARVPSIVTYTSLSLTLGRQR